MNQCMFFNGGGDESKKQWFMRIAGEPHTKICASRWYVVGQIIFGIIHYWENYFHFLLWHI